MAKSKEEFGPSLEDGAGGMSASATGTAMSEGDDAAPEWLSIARNAFEDSERFFDSSIRPQIERNERSFRSRHPSGSKYYSDTYKHRSALFRPKTRAMIRQGEAQLAASYFANEDVLAVRAMNENDEMQVASAQLTREIVQYRLETPHPRIAVPWFMVAVGAYQSAQKSGVVVSKQWWEYREVEAGTEIVAAVDAETGEAIEIEQPVIEVVRDRPVVQLIPIENVRIDRSADWSDPVHSSPFVILQHPMYVQDVEARMRVDNEKTGEAAWHHVDRSVLLRASGRRNWDSTRSAREDNREDSKESETAVGEFAVVWVHENFVTWDGRDYVYYTAGTEALLSDPQPVHEVYRHCAPGERPIVMGQCLVEAHRIYPAGKPELTEDLQREANDVVNQRLDNVRLALNKRYLVKRGAQVDLRSIVRNSPGSATLVSDTEKDVKTLETRDVTASAYQEQDRINADFDEIAGQFLPGSVQTNRRMNETVGGMQLMAGGANMVGEMDLRTFTETWAQPVLRQVVRLVQTYETDITVIGIAADKAQVFQRFGIDQITDELLGQDLTVRVNVGMGATDPTQRLNRMLTAGKTIRELFGDSVASLLNAEEIVKEVMASLGFRDGKRFFRFGDEDPMVLMLQQQMDELQSKLERKEIDAQAKTESARLMALGRVVQQLVENQGVMEHQTLRGLQELGIERERASHQDRQRNIDMMGDIIRGGRQFLG